MSVDICLSPSIEKLLTRGEKVHSFTFPALDAEVTASLVAELKLHAALFRLARKLCKQYPRMHGQRTIGITVTNISFCFMLGDKAEGSHAPK